jgi:hypothetical protein
MPDCLMNVQLAEPELPSKVHKTNRGHSMAEFGNSRDTPGLPYAGNGLC